MHRNIYSKGTTLIEFIIYLGIVTILLVGVGATSLGVLQEKAKAGSVAEVNRSGAVTMEVLTRMIREAKHITSPLQGATSSTLLIASTLPATDPTRVTLGQGAILVKRGNTATTTLSDPNLTISSLVFSNVSRTNTPGTIQLQYTLSAGGTTTAEQYRFSETFRTSVSLRNNAP